MKKAGGSRHPAFRSSGEYAQYFVTNACWLEK